MMRKESSDWYFEKTRNTELAGDVERFETDRDVISVSCENR